VPDWFTHKFLGQDNRKVTFENDDLWVAQDYDSLVNRLITLSQERFLIVCSEEKGLERLAQKLNKATQDPTKSVILDQSDSVFSADTHLESLQE
jgi:hypothetical protein